MRPFMAEGSYVNYLEDEGDPLARAAYGPNYDRLVALKNKYDPTNFFRMNKEAIVIAALNGGGKLVIKSIVETKASSILQLSTVCVASCM
jgi:hypothetical protein